jgi:ribonuclease P protein component
MEPRSVPTRSPETLPKSRRIGPRRDFKTAYETGAKRYGRFVVVFSRPNGLAADRIGITVTKKVGGSVERNLLKRRVREIYRRFGPARGCQDVVVNLKREAVAASFTALRDDLLRILLAPPRLR